MFDQLEAMQADLKQKLANIQVNETAADGKIMLEATADRKIQNVSIDPDFLKTTDAEELEDLLVVALNNLARKVDEKAAEETKAMMATILPPGLDLPGFMT